MSPTITPIYAILLTILFLVLSARVILVRRGQKIAYGTGEDTDNIALIRAQANWAEYAPIGIVLLLLAELQGISAFWLHICGLTLLTGRYLHGYAMSFNRKFFQGRVFGTALTLGALIILLCINAAALA